MQTYNLQSLREHLEREHAESLQTAYSKDFMVFEDMTQIPIDHDATRLDMAVFALCLEGRGEIVVDTKAYEYEVGSYVILLPNQVVSIPDHVPSKAIGICINENTYAQLIHNLHGMLPLFFYIRQHPIDNLSEEDTAWMHKYHKQIFEELRSDSLFRKQTAKALMIALLYKVCNLYGKDILSNPQIKNRQEEIFTSFLLLVEKNYKQHREVRWYADQMCISPKYLTSVVKSVSQRTPNDWIQAKVISDAKAQLLNTHKTVQEISNDLNFPSQSFFGKYFKHLTSYSPQQFRKIAISQESSSEQE